jgi:hypothetical protein
MSTTAPHKLSPRSTRCVFIGYSLNHKGYHYLDISTNHVVISRHIIFDGCCFPFASSPSVTNDYEIFSEIDSMPSPIGTCLSAGTPMTMADGLTTTLGGQTNLVVEACGLTARPSGGLHDSLWRYDCTRYRDWRSECTRRDLTALTTKVGSPTTPLSGPTA